MAVFQRLINNVLGDLSNNVALPYIANIIIPSINFEDLQNLQRVFEKLGVHNLRLIIEYLGR